MRLLLSLLLLAPAAFAQEETSDEEGEVAPSEHPGLDSPEAVRVFVRHPEQGTRVFPMTQVPDIDRLLKEFALGELWYLLGEEKLVEVQPA